MNTNNIKLSVVGSRTFDDYEILSQTIDKIKAHYNYNIIQIISGGAKGADMLGEKYAIKNEILTRLFLPDWKTYGKRAGFLRNVDIIKNCDVCIAFWDGESKGTKHDIDLCNEHNKTCFIYNFKTQKLTLNNQSKINT